MRKWIALAVFLFFLLLPGVAWAAEGEADLYEEQKEASGADALPDALPDETRELLDQIGMGEITQDSVFNLSPGQFFSQTADLVREEGAAPLKAAVSVIGIIVLCAVLQGVKTSFGEQETARVFHIVCVLAAAALVVAPVVSCAVRAEETVRGSFVFMTSFVPVLSAILTAGGQPVTASSYSLLTLGAADIASGLYANIVVPALNMVLALSVVSSAAPRLNLKGLTSFLQKTVKWILGFSMTIFVSILSLQGVVGNAADSVAVKATKFILGSAVPVVGGALSDALSSVQGYVGLLKTTVGAFGMVAGIFLFLPLLVECLLWLLAVNVCAAVGDILNFGEMADLLRAVGGVIGLLIAIVLSCAFLLIISSGIMMSLKAG